MERVVVKNLFIVLRCCTKYRYQNTRQTQYSLKHVLILGGKCGI